jgi:hypothetical protein
MSEPLDIAISHKLGKKEALADQARVQQASQSYPIMMAGFQGAAVGPISAGSVQVGDLPYADAVQVRLLRRVNPE